MHRYFLILLLTILTSFETLSAQLPRSVGMDHASFLGGNQADIPIAVAYDATGNIIVAGYTASSDFPVTGTGIQQNYAGGTFDVFIAKFDPALGNLLAATYLGGSSADILTDIIIDGQNNIIISGRSNSADFPVTANALDTLHGYSRIFVSKISNNLDTLLASTMAGPSLDDPEYGHIAIAIDSNNQILIAANTQADNFPLQGPGYQKTYSGATDAVIIKLSSGLDQMLSSTYYGSPGNDYLFDIAVSSDQKVYVTGSSNSDSLSINGTVFRDTFSGATDAIIACFSSDLNQLIAAAYYGGVLFDQAKQIEIDQNGNLFIAGNTWSDTLQFGPYAYDYHINGESDVFILKIKPLLTEIITGTYVGGSNNEALAELSIDNNGALYLGGSTWSEDFPIDTFSFDTSYTNSYAEGFAIKFTNNLSKLVESGYLGGSLDDEVEAIALGQNGQLILAGWTQSSDFPLDANGFDTLYHENTDGFLISTQLPSSGIYPLPKTANTFSLKGNYFWVEMKTAGLIEVDYFSIEGKLIYHQNLGYHAAGTYPFRVYKSNRTIQLIRVKMGNNIQGSVMGFIQP